MGQTSTARVQMEDALRGERERLAAILESDEVLETIANYASSKENTVRLIAHLLRTNSTNSALERAAAPIHGRA